MTNPKLNPYPRELADHASGISVPSPKHKAWQEGFEAGWNSAVAVVQTVNKETPDLRTFERMILKAFLEEKR